MGLHLLNKSNRKIHKTLLTKGVYDKTRDFIGFELEMLEIERLIVSPMRHCSPAGAKDDRGLYMSNEGHHYFFITTTKYALTAVCLLSFPPAHSQSNTRWGILHLSLPLTNKSIFWCWYCFLSGIWPSPITTMSLLSRSITKQFLRAIERLLQFQWR